MYYNIAIQDHYDLLGKPAINWSAVHSYAALAKGKQTNKQTNNNTSNNNTSNNTSNNNNNNASFIITHAREGMST